MTTTKRSTRTTVIVDDGQTIVLGGLIQDAQNEANTSVPCLGNVPLFGVAFRQTDVQSSKTNLLIFLTPHIITTHDDVERVTTHKREQAHRPEALERKLLEGQPKDNLEGCSTRTSGEAREIMARPSLTDILLDSGDLTAEQLSRAEALSAERQLPMPEVLLRQHMISDDALLRAQGRQLGLSYWKELPEGEFDVSLMQRVPLAFARQHQWCRFACRAAWRWWRSAGRWTCNRWTT